MKSITKRMVAVLLAASLVLFGVTPMVNVSAASKAPTKITLNTTKASINVKGTVKLSVKSVVPSKADKSVNWTTSNKKVATITSKGVVKGIKAGTVTITATSKRNKKVVAKCKVTVINPSIKLSSKSLTLNSVGEKNKATLKATVKGASKTITWKSSNTKIVTVDKYGNLTAKKKGSATITATSNGKSATSKVTVIVPSIAITASKASIYSAGTGSTVTLKAYSDGIAKTATWTSSNKSVATVNSKGVVTGKKAGTVTITAKIGRKTIKCTVTVKTQSLTLSKSSLSLYPNQTYALKGNAVGKSRTVSWTTSNSKVATVSGGVVTARAAGVAYIYAKANGLTVSCKITVKAPTLTLSNSTISIFPTQTYILKAYPYGASQTVTWSSSSSSIATVDSKGVVRGIKAGKATIYAKANGVTKSCTVTVIAPTLSLDQTNMEVIVGQTATIKASVYGPSQTVTWKSSNNNVATVINGVVTGVAEGSATITATANGVSKSCTVTVLDDVNKSIVLDYNTSYVMHYDGSQGYREVTRDLNAETFAQYKDLYFDRLVSFLDRNKDDIFTGWKTARDFTKTIDGKTVTVESMDDGATKKITVSLGSRTEVVTVKVEKTAVANEFNVTLTRNDRSFTFNNVKFSSDEKNYKVEFTKFATTYTLLVGVDCKSAEFKCGDSTIAKYTDTGSTYEFNYNKDLLNNFSESICEVLGQDAYRLGDILDATTFIKK